MAATCKKVGGSVTEALKEQQCEDHELVPAAGDKVWLVSLKGVEQPKFSFYHRTPLHGGYTALFEGGKWRSAAKFDAIDKDENREHKMFVTGDGSLCMLVYSEHERFRLHHLLKWGGSGWEKMEIKGGAQVEVAGDSMSLEMAPDAGDADNVHFILAHGGCFTVFKLAMGNKEGTVTKIQLQPAVCPLTGQPSFRLIAAAVHSGHLYAFCGHEMCGFRWQAEKLFDVDLASGNSTVADIGGDSPPWSYGGPRAAVPLAHGHWLMAAGCRAKGMEQTESDQSIWSVDLSGRKWTCVKGELPKSLGENGAAFGGCPKDMALYGYGPDSGLIKIAYSKV